MVNSQPIHLRQGRVILANYLVKGELTTYIMYPLSNITLDYSNIDCTRKGLNMIHSFFEGPKNKVVNRSSSETPVFIVPFCWCRGIELGCIHNGFSLLGPPDQVSGDSDLQNCGKAFIFDLGDSWFDKY